MEVAATFALILVILASAGGINAQNENLLLWETSDTSLRFLTQEMSDMENFKSTVLNPMLVERVSGTAGNMAVRQHIKSSLPDWHIEEDHFTDTTPLGVKDFTNIIATFDPTKPTKIVLACHFDSKFMGNVRFVGATDSAVPCAILLETVKQLECLMQKGPQIGSSASNLTLQLLFLDGEEAFKEWTRTDSIYGARHLAARYSKEPDPVNGSITKIQAIREFILLDLIGTNDTSIPQQFTRTSELYQHLFQTERYLRNNGYLTGNHSGPIFTGQQSWGQIDDDHMPFLQRDVAVVHLISAPFPSVWHKSIDDLEHLDFYLIDDFSRIFRVFISNLLHLQPENRSCRKKPNCETVLSGPKTDCNNGQDIKESSSNFSNLPRCCPVAVLVLLFSALSFRI